MVSRAARAIMPTSRTSDRRPLKNTGGFTLIEIMITIAIMAFVVAMVLPKINNKNNDLRATVRRFTVLNRELRNRAQLQNATYRIAIDMETDEATGRRVVLYWVERGPGSLVNNYDAKNPPKPPKKEDADNKDAPPPLFAPDPTILKSKKEIDGDLEIESVELGNVDEPVTTGLVYIHYLPSGYVDEAVIHLKGKGNLNWSLATEPLTGRMDVIPENRLLKDLKAK
jgi:prepilin-type N-terminal cleavage/methylation domain-containing protein